MSRIVITELLGDGIGSELRESVYAVADALPLDLSLDGRERGGRRLFEEVAAAMRDTRIALKYPAPA